jgi:hypothetical protein
LYYWYNRNCPQTIQTQLVGIDGSVVLKTDLEETGCECWDWIELAQDRVWWQSCVPQKAVSFRTSCVAFSLSGRTLLHEVNSSKGPYQRSNTYEVYLQRLDYMYLSRILKTFCGTLQTRVYAQQTLETNMVVLYQGIKPRQIIHTRLVQNNNIRK